MTSDKQLFNSLSCSLTIVMYKDHNLPWTAGFWAKTWNLPTSV